MKILYAVLLHQIGLSHKKLHSLYEMGVDFEEFYKHLSQSSLQKIYDKSIQIEKLLEAKKSVSETIILQKLEKLNVQVISYHDQQYPELLRQVYAPPFLLYVQGTLDNRPTFGVVGSRKMSEYGKKVIETLVPDISKYFTIVSGGAFGCDTYAHRVTLDAKQKTIVVVGTGIDVIYPQINKPLYDEVVNNAGAIISIFPLGTYGNNYTFPIRNEIIAGISQGVLVVEAAQDSGSLITAKLALEQSREVFAVPGDIFRSNSIGCAEIIKKGEAKLVLKPQDILEEYNISLEQTEKKLFELNDGERYIYQLLTVEDKGIDSIAKNMGKDVGEVSIYLSRLELKGAVVKLHSGKYQIR